MNERELIRALIGDREDLWLYSAEFHLGIQIIARGVLSFREDLITRSEKSMTREKNLTQQFEQFGL